MEIDYTGLPAPSATTQAPANDDDLNQGAWEHRNTNAMEELSKCYH
jgi:hypothetical protein